MTTSELIIGERNTGKTTYLINKFELSLKQNKKIIILDSATEHKDKSLLLKIADTNKIDIIGNNYLYNKILTNKDINDIKSLYKPRFVFKKCCTNNIIGYDLSYFLEKAHDIYDKTHIIELYHYYRKIYNDLSQELIISLIYLSKIDKLKNTVVIMDEIEFPIININKDFLKNNLELYASVHPENSRGTFYESFNIRILKRKEY